MEELNNLLPINNNANQDNFLNNNNDQQVIRELESEDYQIIIFNFLPSAIYCIIITMILCIPIKSFFNGNNTIDEDFSQVSHIISYLKIMFIIYSFYILKSIFYYQIVTKIEINNSIHQLLISLIYFIIDIFYYISTVAGYYSFQRLSLNFIINNLYKCIFIYCLIFIGIVHICLLFLNFFYILLSFIFSLNNFFENEMGFIAQQGELPMILDQLLVSQKADSQHCKACYICLDEIEKGQEIITLKCNNSHFFHSKCIKLWLRYNISCPLCRNQNII